MNFLFDGRMKVGDLPDEIRRAADLLDRAGASHVYQVRLQLRLLVRYDQLLVDPDQYDFHDIVRVPSLSEVLTADFSDGFANQNIEVSQEMPRALNSRQHVGIMRGETGCDRGPPTVEKLLGSLNLSYDGNNF